MILIDYGCVCDDVMMWMKLFVCFVFECDVDVMLMWCEGWRIDDDDGDLMIGIFWDSLYKCCVIGGK